MTQPSPAPRFWPTAGPSGLAVIGLAALTAISVRFAFRSALLYPIAVEFVNRWGLEYTGLRFEDTQGSGWKIAVHPDDRAAFVSARRKALATGEPFEIEARFRRADGVYRWFLTRVAPLRDESGGIVRW